ncbi:transcriptional regulator [Cutibacterium acnes JCM 18918]|nr:transcriptional regulator [Cutibacterium acnes JCM 18918]
MDASQFLGSRSRGSRAEELIAGHLPDAVLAGNDDIAIGMCHTFLTHGVRIPDDIGIVGFDDIPQARWMTPSLTTVVQDFEALGRQAVEAAEASSLERLRSRASSPPLWR